MIRTKRGGRVVEPKSTVDDVDVRRPEVPRSAADNARYPIRERLEDGRQKCPRAAQAAAGFEDPNVAVVDIRIPGAEGVVTAPDLDQARIVNPVASRERTNRRSWACRECARRDEEHEDRDAAR